MAADTAQLSQIQRFSFTVLRNLAGCLGRLQCPDNPAITAFLLVTWLFGSPVASVCRGIEKGPLQVRYNLYELPSAKRAMRQLASEVSFFWEQKPLREGLQELCGAHGLSLWLDRRIDPSKLVTTSVNVGDDDRSLNAALLKIATFAQAEVALIENVVYFGPRKKSAFLQRAAVGLHDAISRQLPDEPAQMRGLSWQGLTIPSDLLQQISNEWQVRIDGELPHDLMHAGELVGPATLATQLTIVCGGFDMEVELISGDHFRLRALEHRDRWQTVYKKRSLNASTIEQTSLKRLLKKHPQSRVREQGGQWEILATTNLHVAVLKPPPRAQRAADLSQQRWTFEVQNKPAELVIQFFANSIGLEVQWDAACSANDREHLVSFRVDDADLDALLKEFALASGLDVQREELMVRISP